MIETNVHFPTDINLLFDAMRKVIVLISRLCDSEGVKGWRQSKHNIKKLKKQVFKLQKLKHSTSKDPLKALKKVGEIKTAYAEYARTASLLLEMARKSEIMLLELGVDTLYFDDIHYFTTHAEKQIDLITRRVINGEKILHKEKVFSVFEPHTEWICKGKAGVPVELRLRAAILEDQNGFILAHQIMPHQTDEQIAIPIVRAAKENFPELRSCSFDKGFHSPSNQDELGQILDAVALPKKGKLSKKDKEHYESIPFKTARKKHAAVESAINALEVHGLDRCPDKGIKGFECFTQAKIESKRKIKLRVSATKIASQRNQNSKYEGHLNPVFVSCSSSACSFIIFSSNGCSQCS